MLSQGSFNTTAIIMEAPRPLMFSRRPKADFAVEEDHKNATWELSAASSKRKRATSKISKTRASLLADLQDFRNEMELSSGDVSTRRGSLSSIGSAKKMMLSFA